MGLNKPYKVNRRRKHNSLLPVLILVAAAVCISLAVAGLWQMAAGDTGIPGRERTGRMPGAPEPSSKAAPSEGNSSSEEEEPSSSQEESSSEPEDHTAWGAALPESAPVEAAYFDDAVFVGDSITEGWLIYTGMENARVLAGTGINCSTIYTAAVVKLEDGTRSTIMDELAKTQYKKVYVMLGGNEVRDMEKDAFLSRYSKVLDDIRAAQPEALIYVQSMTPVTQSNNYNMDNKRIDDFNEAIKGLCAEKKMYYLNVAECMKDEQGMLPNEASPADGMHFGQDYFNKWLDYLKTHTVQEG